MTTPALGQGNGMSQQKERSGHQLGAGQISEGVGVVPETDGDQPVTGSSGDALQQRADSVVPADLDDHDAKPGR